MIDDAAPSPRRRRDAARAESDVADAWHIALQEHDDPFALDTIDDGAEASGPQEAHGPRGRAGRSSGRPLILALLRPWFEPRPGELRGVIVLLAVSLAVSLALWFDASRRPTLDAAAPSTAHRTASVVGSDEGVGTLGGGTSPGSADGSDGWGLGPTGGARLGPVVHVSGAVREPGIVTLPEGSRVADAVAASGGATPDALLDRLNLARRVDDGERIHVLRVGEEAPPPDAPASRGVLPDGRIDLNAASQAELETLPGVGPARARAIIAERETRPYRVPGDLRRVAGIGEATFQRLAPLVAVR
jgi:comEA protein